MVIERRRVVLRKDSNRAFIEDHELGLFLADYNLENPKNLYLTEYELFDVSSDGNILLLNSKKWLTKRNANKTRLTAFNIATKETFFKTDNFLAFRSIIDATSTQFLLQYYDGLSLMNLTNGEIIFQKNMSKSLYNADLHNQSNRIFIPTEKKSILIFDFNTQDFEEVRMEKLSATTWIKFDKQQNRILISDKKNCIHCFDVNSIQKPIWTIDFSSFEQDSRIWPGEIIVTDSNLGCILGTRPDANQVGFVSGGLFIFDMNNGKVLDKFESPEIRSKIVCDINADEIILDNLSTLSLSKKTISKTGISKLAKVR